jgi:uncharacterized membrane protein YkvI
MKRVFVIAGLTFHLAAIVIIAKLVSHQIVARREFGYVASILEVLLVCAFLFSIRTQSRSSGCKSEKESGIRLILSSVLLIGSIQIIMFRQSQIDIAFAFGSVILNFLLLAHFYRRDPDSKLAAHEHQDAH